MTREEEQRLDAETVVSQMENAMILMIAKKDKKAIEKILLEDFYLPFEGRYLLEDEKQKIKNIIKEWDNAHSDKKESNWSKLNSLQYTLIFKIFLML